MSKLIKIGNYYLKKENISHASITYEDNRELKPFKNISDIPTSIIYFKGLYTLTLFLNNGLNIPLHYEFSNPDNSLKILKEINKYKDDLLTSIKEN